MYSDSDLMEEVFKVIETTLNRGESAPASWVARVVLAEHQSIEGEDKDFFVLCANTHVRDVVRRAVNKYKPSPEQETDPQLVLPGFNRLQRAYSVIREGDHVVVPVDWLTDEEIEEKAVEYERMAKGCQQHAEELRRYRASRRAAAE